VPHTLDKNKTPLLAGVVARFDCKTWNVVEGGDHWIIIGEVTGIDKDNKEPLVFSGGSYATASPLRSASTPTAATSVEKSPIDSMLLYNLSRAYRQMSEHFHHSVNESGLSVPEWRILASLHSKAHRDLPDLAARTFIDAFVLVDMLVPMQESGLCEINGDLRLDNPDLRICGTDLGHARVEHLFKLAQAQEQLAVGNCDTGTYNTDQSGIGGDVAVTCDTQASLKTLVSLLQKVIDNTC